MLIETVNEEKYRSLSILERLGRARERIISFRVPWIDDNGNVQINKGYRVQFDSAIGPYKGGLRFHPTVNQIRIVKLGFEQVFKNSLTGLPIGGGKGGSNFDPKGKSDREVMAFCQSFMTELSKYIGADTDVPAGDIGVGGREIGLPVRTVQDVSVASYEGVLTGKGLSYGGSLHPYRSNRIRCCIYPQRADYRLTTIQSRRQRQSSLQVPETLLSTQSRKLLNLAAKLLLCVTLTDISMIRNGIKLDIVKDIKEVKRGRIKEYADRVEGASYTEGTGIWNIKCDIYLPCATQNELDLDGC